MSGVSRRSSSQRSISEQPERSHEIHQEYVRLLHRVEDNADEFVKPNASTEIMNRALERSDLLAERSKNTQHVMDDSKLIFTSTGLIRQRASNTKVDTTKDFDLEMYVDALKKILDTNNRDREGNNDDNEQPKSVEDIGALVYRYLCRVPTMDFMVGPLDIDKRLTKRRVVRLDIGAESKPTDVKDSYHGATDAEQATLIKQVYDTLKQVQEQQDEGNVDENPEPSSSLMPVHLFEFVLNPLSFSETVENIFFVSFLIKEGKVSLDMDEDGIPVISIVEQVKEDQEPARKKSKGRSNAQRGRTQLILDLDMKSWNDFCDIYELQEPIIAARGNDDSGKNKQAVESL